MATSQTLAGIGWESVIGIGIESTLGTAVAPTVYLPVIDCNPAITNMLAPRTIMRRSKGQILSGPGQSQAKADFTVECNPNEIGLLLGLAMGADTKTGPTGVGALSGYTHTFKLASPLNAFTLSVDPNAGTVHQYAGSKIDQMDISAKGKQSLQFKFQTLGINDTPISSTLSPTYSTTPEQPFFFENIASPTINGVALQATDFNISLKNNIKPTWYSGTGRFPGQMNETEAQVTGSMTVQASTETINTIVSAVTPVPVVIQFNHATTPYAITFTLPNCIIDTAPISLKKNDINTYAVKFSAFESTPGSNDDLTVVLFNEASSSYVS